MFQQYDRRNLLLPDLPRNPRHIRCSVRKDTVEVRAFAIAAAKQRVFALKPVKRDRHIGSGLTVLRKIRNTCDRSGICALVIADPFLIRIQSVNILLCGIGGEVSVRQIMIERGLDHAFDMIIVAACLKNPFL